MDFNASSLPSNFSYYLHQGEEEQVQHVQSSLNSLQFWDQAEENIDMDFHNSCLSVSTNTNGDHGHNSTSNNGDHGHNTNSTSLTSHCEGNLITQLSFDCDVSSGLNSSHSGHVYTPLDFVHELEHQPLVNDVSFCLPESNYDEFGTLVPSPLYDDFQLPRPLTPVIPNDVEGIIQQQLQHDGEYPQDSSSTSKIKKKRAGRKSISTLIKKIKKLRENKILTTTTTTTSSSSKQKEIHKSPASSLPNTNRKSKCTSEPMLILKETDDVVPDVNAAIPQININRLALSKGNLTEEIVKYILPHSPFKLYILKGRIDSSSFKKFQKQEDKIHWSWENETKLKNFHPRHFLVMLPHIYRGRLVITILLRSCTKSTSQCVCNSINKCGSNLRIRSDYGKGAYLRKFAVDLFGLDCNFPHSRVKFYMRTLLRHFDPQLSSACMVPSSSSHMDLELRNQILELIYKYYARLKAERVTLAEIAFEKNIDRQGGFLTDYGPPIPPAIYCRSHKVQYKTVDQYRKHYYYHHMGKLDADLLTVVSYVRQASIENQQQRHLLSATNLPPPQERPGPPKVHYPMKNGRFMCENCTRSFTTLSGKQFHVKTKHPTKFAHIPRNARSCHVCGLQTKSSFDSKLHKFLAHPQLNVRDPRVCEICETVCPSKSTLYRHMATEHPKGSSSK